MGDWLLNLPIPWMAVVIFAATYLIAACVYLLVFRLAVGDRARAFKAFSPGMLPVLGTIFALLVAFVAVQVWNDFDKAKLAVATEATALRAVDVFAETLPDEQRTQLRALMNRHIAESFETIFMVPSVETTYISSSVVREVAKYHGNLTGLVHPAVAKALAEKFASGAKPPRR